MTFSSNPRIDDPQVGPPIKRRSGAAVAAGLVAVFLFVVLGLSVAGCGEESLVGTWTSAEQGETLDFRPDGTGILTTRSGVMVTLTYEVKGTSLILGTGDSPTRTLGYSIDGGVLTLTFPGEDPARYVRVELGEK